MLLNNDPRIISQEFQDEKKSELSLKLFELQRACIEKNIPVIILVEGWESSGKGYVINELVKDLDTRYFRVNVFDEKAYKDDYLYIRQLWEYLPAYGNFSILYRSMYSAMFNDLKSDEKTVARRIKQVENFEGLLNDDNFIIIKFFMDIDKKTQKDNIKRLEKDKYRNFFVSKEDIDQQKDYDLYRKNMSLVLDETNFEYARWNIVSAEDEKKAAKHIIGTCNKIIEAKLAEIEERKSAEKDFVYVSKEKTTFIEDMNLNLAVSDEDYQLKIDKLQERASELSYKLYTEKIPTVIVFEGIDAAGKGGTIKRLLRKIDPRIYEVNPTSAPSDLEKIHHYLWRFYNNLPDQGELAIFDRSWYGRVMVERVEKFANDKQWSRAFVEINNMERELVDHGVLLLKYHLVISKDEQEKRFKDRQLEKPYKITDEDWRNRGKWDEYIEAMDDMIANTSSQHAPWTLVSSQDKNYARIVVLEDFINNAEKILKNRS